MTGGPPYVGAPDDGSTAPGGVGSRPHPAKGAGKGRPQGPGQWARQERGSGDVTYRPGRSALGLAGVDCLIVSEIRDLSGWIFQGLHCAGLSSKYPQCA